MFALNFLPSFLKEYYSCDMLTKEEWEAERNPSLVVGLTYTILASIFLIVYVPVIIILSRKEFLSVSSCYPIMLSLAIMDVFTLLIIGPTLGYLSIRGDVLCTSFFLVYFTGGASHVGWYTCTLLCVLLAFNRLLETTNKALSRFLFEGRKILLWIIISFLYGLFIANFFPPMLFTGKHYAMFFDPYVDIPKVQERVQLSHFDHSNHYINFPHAIHNIAIAIVLPLLYAIICTVFFVKYKTTAEDIQMTKAQQSLLLQSFLLCVATFLTGTVYIYFQYLPTNDAIIIAGELVWIMSHGVGAFVLGYLNPTIRACIWEEYVQKIWVKIRKPNNVHQKITMVTPIPSK